MTVAATLVGVFLKGTAAARPAANAVAGGAVYSATDTGVITQSDGSSWSTWATISAGMADPLTTRGDLIYRNASNVTARLPIGSSGKVLSSDGTDVSWQTVVAGKTRTRVISLTVAAGASGFWNDADLSRVGAAILTQDGNSATPAMISFYRNGSFNDLLGVGGSMWEFRGGTFSGGGTALSVFVESNSAGARVGFKNNLGFDSSVSLFDWTIAANLA